LKAGCGLLLAVADVPVAILDAALASGVTLLASAVAFRVLVERRLTRLERDAETHPSRELHDRLRKVEEELRVLEPVQDMVRVHGTSGAQRAFGGVKQDEDDG
jgi:membrane protein implicated in regulation of membrane protease activity